MCIIHSCTFTVLLLSLLLFGKRNSELKLFHSVYFKKLFLVARRVLGNLRLSYTFWAPKESASVCAGLKTPARGPGSLVLSVWR